MSSEELSSEEQVYKTLGVDLPPSLIDEGYYGPAHAEVLKTGSGYEVHLRIGIHESKDGQERLGLEPTVVRKDTESEAKEEADEMINNVQRGVIN